MTAPVALTVFDLVVFVAVVVPFALLVRHRTAIPRLPAARDGVRLPRLSIVVPARNEAASIGHAIGSLLALDYPDVEVIAVDDRSGDRTGEVLRDLAARDRRLVVIHVDELPAGWLDRKSVG